MTLPTALCRPNTNINVFKYVAYITVPHQGDCCVRPEAGVCPPPSQGHRGGVGAAPKTGGTPESHRKGRCSRRATPRERPPPNDILQK